jgi:exodeoxyribonuclease VII large subunit
VQQNVRVNNDLLEFLARTGVAKVFTVTELTRQIKDTLEQKFPLVWVAGEASNVRVPTSGHMYLTLKDQGAQIALVMWRAQVLRLPFKIEDGLAIIVQAELTVYPPHGQYQLVGRQVHPRGMGALQLALRQLMEKLRKEGLFAPEHKKLLPFLPRRIGVVTSRTGAAIQDIFRVLRERCPFVPVLLHPVAVQGEGAGQEIADAIGRMNEFEDVDVMIVGRGGGSIEDLWAFNEEIVARAIYASRIPVVSAVGHEIDVTVSDMVADARAATPTHAAQMVVPDRKQLLNRLQTGSIRLARGLTHRLDLARTALARIAQSHVFRQPLDVIVRERDQRLDDLSARMALVARHITPDRRRKLESLEARLKALSPRNVLARGYSITMRAADGKILKEASAAATGDVLHTFLLEGMVESRVEATCPGDSDDTIRK